MRLLRTRTDPTTEEVALLGVENDVRYGSSDGPSWLPSAASVVLDRRECDAVERDLADVWDWYDAWTTLYLASTRGDARPWIAALVEHGLRAHEVAVSRAVARAGLRPLTCRVEYVYRRGRRFIAEAQWVSGGLGFFAGVDSVYRSSGRSSGHAHIGDLGAAVVESFATRTTSDSGVLSVVRDDWLPGERFLRALAAARGVRFEAVDRDRCVPSLGDAHRSGLVYGQGYTGLIPPDLLTSLWHRVAAGELWAESPFNYLYRQKWGLALLHSPDFADLFPPRLRDTTPPTILLNDERPDFSLIAAHRSELEPVAGAKELTDLVAFPERVRRNLVLKCGSGTGGYHSNGRGVFRLTGSRGSARKTVAFVQERIALGEPWIMQPFSSSATRIDGDQEDNDVHVKLMAFGIREPAGGAPVLAAALANYGRHWKVGGRSPVLDRSGHQLGTYFTDVVVAGNGSEGDHS